MVHIENPGFSCVQWAHRQNPDALAFYRQEVHTGDGRGPLWLCHRMCAYLLLLKLLKWGNIVELYEKILWYETGKKDKRQCIFIFLLMLSPGLSSVLQ